MHAQSRAAAAKGRTDSKIGALVKEQAAILEEIFQSSLHRYFSALMLW